MQRPLAQPPVIGIRVVIEGNSSVGNIVRALSALPAPLVVSPSRTAEFDAFIAATTERFSGRVIPF